MFLVSRRLGKAILLHIPSRALQVAILCRGALQMGLPRPGWKIAKRVNFHLQNSIDFEWSLQLASLLRGVLQFAILLLFQCLGSLVKQFFFPSF